MAKEMELKSFAELSKLQFEFEEEKSKKEIKNSKIDKKSVLSKNIKSFVNNKKVKKKLKIIKLIKNQFHLKV